MQAGVTRINELNHDMEKVKKRADMLQQENEVMKAKLLEAQAERGDPTGKSENTKKMIRAVLEDIGKNEELENKRGQGKVLVSPVDDDVAAPPSGKMVRYGTPFLFYYCKACENYGLCETCFNAKQHAEESNDGKNLRKRTRRGQDQRNEAKCDHATINLRKEDNAAYAPRNRTQNMTGKFTLCFRCGYGM